MPFDPDKVLAEMTLEEKSSLTAGLDLWRTVPLPRLGVPSLVLSDGPAGARGATVDHESVTPSVCIPCGSALGATWDRDLVKKASAVVARQAKDKGADVLLAPTLNLHRHPLWGRSFEAFSEDPLLAAELGVAYVRGVQGEGLAATAKHLVANEVEHERLTCSSEVDERTLRELYLLPFEHAVRRGGVRCVMTSYNRLNGRHASDRSELLEGLLRGEWGFEGLVMSDWWALCDTVASGRAGLDLEMPGPARSFGSALAEAVKDGRVAEEDLDAKVRRLLQLIEALGRGGDLGPAGMPAAPGEEEAKPAEGGARLEASPAAEGPAGEHPVDRAEDRAFLRRAAADSLVLLANDGVLPLDAASLSRVALLGPRAEHPGVMGGGSAKVRLHYRQSLADELSRRLGTGVEVTLESAADRAGIDRAVAAARAADVAVLVVGTDEQVESEGYDRDSMDLPGLQDELVERVAAEARRSVVVVASGAPVTMGWAGRVDALLQSFFGGQEAPGAIVDVLLGDSEPGGRLPTTLPLRLEHSPAFASFYGEASRVHYGEGLLVGYRWYEARRLPVAFPFGHGLSYTSFEIGEPKVSPGRLPRGGRLRVEVPVENTGGRRGAEVVQCYVAPPTGGRAVPGFAYRPPKELRAFEKVWLEPGETAVVVLELTERAFATFEPEDKDWPSLSARLREPYPGTRAGAHRARAGWYVEPGRYELCVGRSSVDIAHRVAVEVEGGHEPLDPGAPLA